MKYLIILLVPFLFFCKKGGASYIPTRESLQVHWSNNPPDNQTIADPLKKLFAQGVNLCGTEFKGEEVRFSGDNDNIFVSFSEIIKYDGSAYLSVYKGMDDQWILKSRCCPMGPCYTSYIYQWKNGKYELIDTIPGEVNYYKKTDKGTLVKLQDSFITGLIFEGFWDREKNVLEPKLSYFATSVEIPEFAGERERYITGDTNLKLLKHPREYNIDNLAHSLNIKKGVNVHILAESGDYAFIMAPAAPEDLKKAVGEFTEESYLDQVQGLKIKSNKDLKKILESTFYHFGWVIKSSL